MPSYEYRCDTDKSFVVLSRNIEERDDKVECPDCRSAMTRQLQANPIHFKSKGFYKTGG